MNDKDYNEWLDFMMPSIKRGDPLSQHIKTSKPQKKLSRVEYSRKLMLRALTVLRGSGATGSSKSLADTIESTYTEQGD